MEGTFLSVQMQQSGGSWTEVLNDAYWETQ